MKILRHITLILLLFATVMSCSNDDDGGGTITMVDPQYPMKTLIEDGAMQLSNTQKNSTVTFELGYRFKPFKNGKISALGVRAPDNNTYRITLWDIDKEEILATENIEPAAELFEFKDITPVNITAGTDYFVSFNTNDYYGFNNSGNAIFPAETKDIIVLGYGTYIGNVQMIPEQYSTTAYLGIVDVKFTPDN